jgi:hypothetical protein
LSVAHTGSSNLTRVQLITQVIDILSKHRHRKFDSEFTFWQQKDLDKASICSGMFTQSTHEIRGSRTLTSLSKLETDRERYSGINILLCFM